LAWRKKYDRMQENILAGQRVEKFRAEYFTKGAWVPFAEGTTIKMAE